MIYPFWDEPFGYGILMAIIAVLHVFVSHFAIGGGLYLVVTERRATKAGDQATLEFLQQLRRETTVSWKWIAERLCMGPWRSAANAVRSAQ